MADEIKDVTPDASDPIEVTIKKEKEDPEPSFDYDDYTPTDQEIQDIEKEIENKIKERTKNG